MSLSRTMHVSDLRPDFDPVLTDPATGLPVDLTTAVSIAVDCYTSTWTSVFTARSATGNASGQIAMAWQSSDVSTARELRLVVRVTWTGPKVQSFPSADGASYFVVQVVSP